MGCKKFVWCRRFSVSCWAVTLWGVTTFVVIMPIAAASIASPTHGVVAQVYGQDTGVDVNSGIDADTAGNRFSGDSADEVRLFIALLLGIAVVALLGTFIYWIRSGEQAARSQ